MILHKGNTHLLPFDKILTIVYFMGTVFFAHRTWSSLQNYFDVRRYRKPFREVVYVEIDIPPLPEALHPLALMLNEFGFELQCAERTQQKAKSVEVTGFHYLTKSGDTIAQLAHANNTFFVCFISRFPDDAALMTTFPRGENIQTPQLTVRFAVHDLRTAWAHHGQMIETWTAQKGQPVLIHTQAQMDEVEEWYARTYSPQINRRYTRLFLFSSVMNGLALLWAVILAIKSIRGDDPGFFNMTFFGLLFIPVLEIFLSSWLASPREAVDNREIL